MSKVRKNDPGMGFDVDADEPIVEPAELDTAAEDAPRPRQNNRPNCPIHGLQMVAVSTAAMYTYYACPLKKERKCDQTIKRVRPVGPLKDLYGHGKSRRA